jgi:hypothetical protein
MKHLVTLFLFIVSVHLAWDASVSPEVTGYKLYYGTASGVYTTELNVGNVLNYSIPNVDETKPMFFAAKAYDEYGNESAYSAELEGAVIINTISGKGTITTMQSDWSSGRSALVTVVEKNTGKNVHITISPADDHALTALKIDNAWSDIVSSLTFSGIAANHSVHAVFQKNRTLHGIEWVK